MKRGMTRLARAELADAVRSRYSAAAGKDKRKILHEFIAATGYHEKSAIRILNGPVAVKLRQTRQRTPLCSLPRTLHLTAALHLAEAGEKMAAASCAAAHR